MKRYKALSIIEILLIVVATGVILALIVMALNPAKRVAEERNTRRKENITTIVDAITDYAIANEGILPEGIPVSEKCESKTNEICRTDANSCSGRVNLSVLTDGETFLESLPRDSQVEAEDGIGYNIVQNEKGRITVCAPLAELGVEIKIVK